MDSLDEMFTEYFGLDTSININRMYRELFENDSNIPDEIEGYVTRLKIKGYNVEYASPGYAKTRFDNDQNKDGIINGKMVSTGRIIFSKNYHFDKTPEGWTWKILHNGAKGLYVKPFNYDYNSNSD